MADLIQAIPTIRSGVASILRTILVREPGNKELSATALPPARLSLALSRRGGSVVIAQLGNEEGVRLNLIDNTVFIIDAA